MRWAIQRQLVYGLIVLGVLFILAIGLWFSFFYHTPTCSDGIKNQNEEGIDCGGMCSKLCIAPRVSALWARSVLVAPGVYHAVAMVRNPESAAGTASLPYTFQIFDDKNILIAERRGVMFLNPGEVAPLFEANVITGNRVPAHTYVTFGQALWQRMNPVPSPVRVVSQTLDENALRLSAHIQNTTALKVPSVTLTALLYDADGNLVTASQTKLIDVAPRGENDVVFTWQEPFAKPVVSKDITARVQ